MRPCKNAALTISTCRNLAMKALHHETPVWPSIPMEKALGSPVFLKMEALQPVGSFKIRGIGLVCQKQFAAGVKHLVCASGGNAGLAVAYSARQLGVQATIVVPKTTPEWTREVIAREGATVEVHGEVWDETQEFACQIAEDTNGVAIHPFDDPSVWEGHATMIAECAEAGLAPDAIVVSVGGGGLLCGVLEGMHQVGWQEVPVLAVETEGAASFAASAEAGELVLLDRIDSLAVTLGARQVTPELLSWYNRHEVNPWIVSDRAAVDGCMRFLDDHRVLVEPACGAALSCVYDRATPIQGRSCVLVIVCGGAGTGLELLKTWDDLAIR